ncbi:hypothetical protein C9I99_13700 [Photobacterium lutimaris]|uniref:Uncharacterized protein n=1 Tax=Photobacterium lutimaris TaxID=388278 RepID=A0A2T3IXJ3_9GAMM|nr:hypothetical protein C9I99_13700 [Photobacterium lutimaris]
MSKDDASSKKNNRPGPKKDFKSLLLIPLIQFLQTYRDDNSRLFPPITAQSPCNESPFLHQNSHSESTLYKSVYHFGGINRLLN